MADSGSPLIVSKSRIARREKAQGRQNMTKNESVRPLVEFRGVEKRYGSGPAAVERLDLSVPEGEFLSLLGPSGSGKTYMEIGRASCRERV